MTEYNPRPDVSGGRFARPRPSRGALAYQDKNGVQTVPLE